MTCRLIPGQREWSMDRGEDGHRTYTITHEVETDVGDGPFNVLNFTPGLPLEGDEWNFDGDRDPWAYCMPTAKVAKNPAVAEGHPVTHYLVTQTFTTKPPDVTKQRCSEIKVEDPLLEPPKVSGTFNKYTEEATKDRFGNPILSSSHEMLRGPQNEWDANRLTVKIEQNVATPLQGYELPGAMLDTVNDAPLWGLARRCVKLSAAPWERVFYGRCNVYYKRTLEFEIRIDTFDRDLLDEGSKLLHGHWDPVGSGAWVLDDINGSPPDPKNPTHFDRAQDKNGNIMRVVLDGAGKPAETATAAGFFVSIIGDNLAHPLTDTLSWLPALDDPRQTPVQWSPLNVYDVGNLVTDDFSDPEDPRQYIALAGSGPFDPQVPASSPSVWRQVILVNSGVHDNVTTYEQGSYVTSDSGNPAGHVHVEKYGESNFLLLGIPTTF